ncbi:MAG: RtcB family protein, partial [Nitrososphaerota archaeon]
MSARVPLQKVGPNVWVIPKSYRQDMRVPVYVFASEKLLEKMTTDRTLIQGVNVATLPGVQKHVAVLPDAHEGYGFPIGGVAAMDATEGVISPGGVGYDINCLPAGTMVLTSLGYRIPIERFTGDEEVVCVNQKRSVPAGIVFVIKKGRDRLLRIRTKSRFVLTATPDHPVLTPDGMKPLEEIRPGERIALFPFEGVEYEDPGDRVILDETDLPENVRSELKKRGLLPLRLDNPKLPYLARLLGYFTGDGTFDGKATVFYGSAEGLEEIRRDIELLGYRPSRVLTRRRQSVINGRKFIGVEGSVRVSSRSFTELLKRLGAPDGKKTDVEFLVPRWILAAPRWIKRLYLAGLFGAELNKPQTVNGYNFEVPQLTLSKRPDLELNGRLFLEQIAELLRELGVETTSIVAAQEGRCVRLRLLISERPENLIRLWSRVGYEYNPQRRRLALAAVVWLRLKQSVIDLRMRAQEVAIAMAADGAT